MPHGTDEAEDRQSNFYDARVNLDFLCVAVCALLLFVLGLASTLTDW